MFKCNFIELTSNNYTVNDDLKRGHFYWQSTIPEIGWHFDWEDKYLNGKEND